MRRSAVTIILPISPRAARLTPDQEPALTALAAFDDSIASLGVGVLDTAASAMAAWIGVTSDAATVAADAVKDTLPSVAAYCSVKPLRSLEKFIPSVDDISSFSASTPLNADVDVTSKMGFGRGEASQ